MQDDVMKKILNDTGDFDEGQADSIRTMIGEFYSRRMRSTALMVWASALVLVALAVLTAVYFFQSADTKSQIMYTAIFIVLMQWIGLMKIFAWQMIHRNSIKREIKRLELRLLAGEPRAHPGG